jgi:hypothetical protein
MSSQVIQRILGGCLDTLAKGVSDLKAVRKIHTVRREMKMYLIEVPV